MTRCLSSMSAISTGGGLLRGSRIRGSTGRGGRGARAGVGAGAACGGGALEEAAAEMVAIIVEKLASNCDEMRRAMRGSD